MKPKFLRPCCRSGPTDSFQSIPVAQMRSVSSSPVVVALARLLDCQSQSDENCSPSLLQVTCGWPSSSSSVSALKVRADIVPLLCTLVEGTLGGGPYVYYETQN